MEGVPFECKKSLDQLLGEALAERSREEEQVEVTYEFGGGRTQKHPRSAFKEEGDQDNADPLGWIALERRVWRSTLLLSAAVVLCCNGFHMLQSLQSSLFPESGVHALLVTYSCGALSCVVAPAITSKLATHWTTVLFGVASCLYFASFYFYDAYGFTAAAVVLGLSLGPMFCACAAHLSLSVSRLPYVTQSIRDKTQQRFLRLFCVATKSSYFWGNLVASLVMRFDVRSVPLVDEPSANSSVEMVTSSYDLCFRVETKHTLKDLSFKYWNEDEVVIQFNSLHRTSLRALLLLFACFVVAGVLLTLLVLERGDSIQGQDPIERPLLLQTLRQIRLVLVDKKIRYCILLIVFSGYEQGFIWAEFTRSYVNCSLGLQSVVFTMMCLGGCTTLGCVAVHLFAEHFPRTIVLAAGFVCQSGLLMVIYLWRPLPDDAPVFYVIAGGWGLCHAVWETLITTYFASTYVDNWLVPFTTLYLLQYTGVALSLGASELPVAQFSILVTGLAVSIAPYTALEFNLHHRSTLRNRRAPLHQSTIL